jgi:alkanesulfonate monooxygenase SsuD/methylene tetrahydromethanopterin reductase-like flavin-dependent oxidoreductase (luciferase family)
MECNHFLTAFLPDREREHTRIYADMIAQAEAADRLGYAGVCIPEHHLINILLVPSPLQMAVRLAATTSHIRLVTAVVVLPLHDARILAGEVAQADMLCEGRLVLGVGRGAFAYEMGRLGVPIESSRERFDETLDVLLALLAGEDVSWDGAYYSFEPLTTMPRPVRGVPVMIAALNPEAVYHCARRGFHVQTTPLGGSHQRLLEQVDAFRRGRADAGAAGRGLRLGLMRGVYAARDEREAREKLELAFEYYKRFDNVFGGGPGLVHGGMIEPLPRKQSIEELGENLVICPPSEMIERLAGYAETGIDELILSSNFGQPVGETLEMMQRFSEEVMPHLGSPAARAAG